MQAKFSQTVLLLRSMIGHLTDNWPYESAIWLLGNVSDYNWCPAPKDIPASVSDSETRVIQKGSKLCFIVIFDGKASHFFECFKKKTKTILDCLLVVIVAKNESLGSAIKGSHVISFDFNLDNHIHKWFGARSQQSYVHIQWFTPILRKACVSA